MGYQIVQSVIKAMNILELLTDQTTGCRVLTLAEIAQATGQLPATTRNLLRTLEQCGYVSRVGHGRYEEGPQCCKLFRSEGIIRKLKEAATPLIRQTTEDLGESILMVTIVKEKRVELLRCQAPDDTLIEPQWSANADFYQMRTTRAILAWYSPEQLNNFIAANELPTLEEWPECQNSQEGLKAELLKIRRNGGCLDQHSNLAAIAVPILTNRNEVVASLGCYAPLARTDKPRAAGIMKMLHDCARQIQDELGKLG